MSEFNVGDSVILNPECKVGDELHGYTFYTDMMFSGPSSIKEIAETEVLLTNGYYYPKEWLLPYSKYKKGEKVRINPDLVNMGHIKFGLVSGMLPFAGTIVTIRTLRYNHYKPDTPEQDGVWYTIEEDKGVYSWSSEAFLPIEDKQLKIKRNEDQLQRKEGLVSRGGRLSECGICYRRNKASISIGHLSKREVSCH